MTSGTRHNAVAAWFLGPRAENSSYVFEYFNRVLAAQTRARKRLHPKDQEFITPEMQESAEFTASMELLDVELGSISTLLAKHSVPFWSPRYNGHMVTEPSLPATIGYLSAMLYNQNNVALEASPYTTVVEALAAEQLCKMLGYNIRLKGEPVPQPLSWGHITCGGSVANLESIWAARNLKLYPLSLQLATRQGAPLEFITRQPSPFNLTLADGTAKPIKDCEAWDLLNLKPDTVLDIPQQLFTLYGISQTFLEKALKPFSIQTLGLEGLRTAYGLKNPPGKILVPATKHYSWPKGAAIAGIGSDNVVDIGVDNSARMDLKALESKLRECLGSKIPVYAVVAVIGSTEHGAVDPLHGILAARKRLEKDGLSFVIHADAAWGGYFASMLVERPTREELFADSSNVPALSLSAHTETQLLAFKNADSITIDPHKSGYTPYPAGGLCYRDGQMRYLVTWTSPVVFRDADAVENIGVYGVEGSKPGAAGVGTYLPVASSAGSQCQWTRYPLYCHWATMAPLKPPVGSPKLIVVPFNMLPAEQKGASSDIVEKERAEILKITKLSNDDLVQEENRSLLELLEKLGGDLMINAFACNFRVGSNVNTDVIEVNYLNKRIFSRLSVPFVTDKVADRPIILTSTTLTQREYGACLTKLKERLGLRGNQDLYVLINVTMSPWPTTTDLLTKMTGEFQDVVDKLVDASIARNTRDVETDPYRFILQGTEERIYGVYLPGFNKGDGRAQFVISGKLPAGARQKYLDARKQAPGQFFTMTIINTTGLLLDITKEGASFKARMDRGIPKPGDPPIDPDFTFSDISIVVHSDLTSNALDTTYPELMSFNLYGTAKQQHIDHILRASPNVMLNSDQVCLSDMNPALTTDQLEKGMVAVLTNVRENSLQPMQRRPGTPSNHLEWRSQAFDFIPDALFTIAIYDDWANAKKGQNPKSTGKLKLGKSVFADDDLLNEDPGASIGVEGPEPQPYPAPGPPGPGRPRLGLPTTPSDAPAIHLPRPFIEGRGITQHNLAEEWRSKWEETKQKMAAPRKDW